ncbi:MAG: ABC transporter permease [Methanomassiliicoccales archaeon]|nr:ABC transporter permease [Methanomassiliicoccales archaeon]
MLLIPVLLGVSIFVFSLTRMAGDPAAAYNQSDRPLSEAARNAINERYHLNDPVYVQYFYWLEGVIGGDWGYSPTARLPVTEAIGKFFPATFELTMISILIAIVIGIALGTISAVRRDTPADHATRIMALSGVSLPVFWLGLMLQFIFGFSLKWLPLDGRYDTNLSLLAGNRIHEYTGFRLIDTILNGNWTMFGDAFLHIILPAITLSFGTIAIVTRIMRSSMLEVMNLDYVRTARSKGLPERLVIRKHARRNAMIPTTTVIGLSFGGLLSGAVLTESIFSWPGLGRWSASATLSNDWNAILGFTLLAAFIYVVVNLAVDVLYAYLDPRVRLE